MQTNGSLAEGHAREDCRDTEDTNQGRLQRHFTNQGWDNTFENRMTVFRGMVMKWINEEKYNTKTA